MSLIFTSSSLIRAPLSPLSYYYRSSLLEFGITHNRLLKIMSHIISHSTLLSLLPSTVDLHWRPMMRPSNYIEALKLEQSPSLQIYNKSITAFYIIKDMKGNKREKKSKKERKKDQTRMLHLANYLDS